MIILSLVPNEARSDCAVDLDNASKYYEMGNFEELLNLLSPCLREGHGSKELQAEICRLMAMTYLAVDEFRKATDVVRKLLNFKPDFVTTLRDPRRFTVLVAKEKDKLVTVVSASKQVETLREVPVPVTVITRRMIKNIGARTLKDVLITYVPGMSFVQDHNEVNVAARGVYSSSQQKILIMLDGHRLNQRVYSEANPDFSISLDKVRQIEVLRGPGSSLYGNVALTAVINIVTRSGREVDGLSLYTGLGNNGQRKVGITFGKQFGGDHDLLMWGASYRATGERVRIPPERNYSRVVVDDAYAILDGFMDRPSYDLGVKYRVGNLSLFGSTRYSKYIEPFTAGGETGETYDYDQYRLLFGVGPGLGSKFDHFGATFEHVVSQNLSIQLRGYYDKGQIQVHVVTDPVEGEFGAPGWIDRDLGGLVEMRRDFSLGGLGSANLILGGQVDRMDVLDSYYPLGTGGTWDSFKDTRDNPLLPKASETVYSFFSQFKHYLNEAVIFNIGARLDIKDRYTGKNVSYLSPRLAAIYLPNKRVSLKISYARSFVDVPFFYRHNTLLGGYIGGESLQPEKLSSLQVTPTFSFDELELTSSFNFFYNRLTDFIWRDNSVTDLDAQNYFNAGVLKSWGLEGELALIKRRYRVRGNVTYQRVVEARNVDVIGSKISNIPSLTANAILDVKIPGLGRRGPWMNLNVRFVGEQASPLSLRAEVEASLRTSGRMVVRDNRVKAVAVVNAGSRVDDVLFAVSLDFRVYNLFDTEYRQGGSVAYPYPQPGRWWLLELTYKFE